MGIGYNCGVVSWLISRALCQWGADVQPVDAQEMLDDYFDRHLHNEEVCCRLFMNFEPVEVLRGGGGGSGPKDCGNPQSGGGPAGKYQYEEKAYQKQ